MMDKGYATNAAVPQPQLPATTSCTCPPAPKILPIAPLPHMLPAGGACMPADAPMHFVNPSDLEGNKAIEVQPALHATQP